MGQILRHWRVPAAVLFSAVLIIGAYLLARNVESPSSAQASTETALLQAIAAKDSDGDGLPDWEESLYGTDPHVTDTYHLGMTDGEAVARGLIVPKAIADIPVATSTPSTPGANGLPPPPAEGTLTAAFAKSFFMLYLAAKQAAGGADLTKSQMSDVSNKALSSLSTTITRAPDFKSANNLTVSGSGIDAMKVFAANAEAVFLKNTNNAKKSETSYLKAALDNTDPTALTQIAAIAKTYRDSAVGLAVIPVPTELAESDLALINSIMRMSEIINDFTLVHTDPLAAMLALQQYAVAVQSFASALANVDAVYTRAGIALSKGTPGASLVNFMSDIARGQQSATRP